MRTDLQVIDVSWLEDAHLELKQGAERIEVELARYDLDASYLSARFESLRSGAIRSRIELHLPDEVLPANLVGRELVPLVHNTFELLLQRFEQYSFPLDPARWRPIGHHTGAEGALRRYHDELLRYALPVLHRVVAHDAARYIHDGDLVRGRIDPSDVVDAVFAARLPALDGSEPIPDVTWRLIDDVRAMLDAKVNELQDESEHNRSLDDRTPVPGNERFSPDLERQALGDQDGDERLFFADLVEDASAVDALQVVDDHERRDQLVRALFTLPEEQRRRFSQVVVDGWSAATVASAWNLPEADIRGSVQIALRQLAGQLRDSVALEPDEIREVYTTLGRTLRDERKADERAFIDA